MRTGPLNLRYLLVSLTDAALVDTEGVDPEPFIYVFRTGYLLQGSCKVPENAHILSVHEDTTF